MSGVGFTGTRAGMTSEQRTTVNRLLRELAPIWAHHGDCIGSDDQFHDLAKLAGAKIMLHPPEKPDLPETPEYPDSPASCWTAPDAFS